MGKRRETAHMRVGVPCCKFLPCNVLMAFRRTYWSNPSIDLVTTLCVVTYHADALRPGMYRFEIRPESARQRYGDWLITPDLMPDANVDIDDLPMVGVKEAAKLEVTAA